MDYLWRGSHLTRSSLFSSLFSNSSSVGGPGRYDPHQTRDEIDDQERGAPALVEKRV